ncbi:ABC transporter ATP-binding protein [Halobacillus litoralis]|uniref:ABC transporter ATP-binding protein n=1 Tax=Halobacillus litoralis TaxID=45668 RepID=UPI001CFD113E|nr:ABC transporter ATP-binding protein [Halobacillus litoralis]
MRRIFSYTFPYKRSAFIAVFLMLIELVIELSQPILMAKIIDNGILDENFSAVFVWGGVLLALSLLAFSAGVTNSFFAAHLSQGTGFDLRMDLFQQVQYFSDDNFQQVPTPSLVTRMTNDVMQVQSLLFMFVRIGLRAPLFVIFALAMVFTLNQQLALVLLVSVPVFLLFLFFILTRGVRAFRKVQHKLDRLNTKIRESLTGIRLIKGFNRETFEEQRFNGVNRSLVEENKRALWLMEMAMPTVMLGMNMVIMLLLFLGNRFLNLGAVEAGELVAVINYATRIMFTFSVFTFLVMIVSRGYASANRIEGVLNQEVVQPEESNSEKVTIKGKVRFSNVSFERAGRKVLHNLSFKIDAGKTVGIIGETGSGKSSLLYLIPRLYEELSGELFVDGIPVEEIPVHHLRNQIGLVPQEAHLFSGTVRENIEWGKEGASFSDVIEAAKKAQIHDFITSLPKGYETQIGQKGVVFSGGQKQRLSIARAFIREPRILILDDSTSALDAHTEKRLLSTLDDQPCTVFIVAQKISSLERADLILLLHQGSIAAQGTHEELLNDSAHYREIYQSQKEKVMP